MDAHTALLLHCACADPSTGAHASASCGSMSSHENDLPPSFEWEDVPGCPGWSVKLRKENGGKTRVYTKHGTQRTAHAHMHLHPVHAHVVQQEGTRATLLPVDMCKRVVK